MIIKNYDDFILSLMDVGFSLGGENDNGIFTIFQYDLAKDIRCHTSVKWHTGNFETDPWEWRMRVLNERNDIAYSKVFYGKSGYITKEWYPYFLAIRRKGMSFEEEYFNGTISQYGKRVYDVIRAYENLPLHKIKQLSGFGKEDKSKFERALVELQMKMYITMCGRQKKLSKMGEAYGWASTMFCTVEKFWDEDLFTRANNINEQIAFEKITEHILKLNPKAEAKKISKFIKG